MVMAHHLLHLPLRREVMGPRVLPLSTVEDVAEEDLTVGAVEETGDAAAVITAITVETSVVLLNLTMSTQVKHILSIAHPHMEALTRILPLATRLLNRTGARNMVTHHRLIPRLMVQCP